MSDLRDKGTRNYLAKKKFLRRIKNLAYTYHVFGIGRLGTEERVLYPKFEDLKQVIKEDPKAFVKYRTTGSPCSCEMCSPDKYNREKKKVYDN